MSTPIPSPTPLQLSLLPQIPTSLQLIETLKSLQKITQINIESPQFKSELKYFSEEHLMLYKSNTSQEGDEKFVCFLKEQRLEGEKQKMWYVSQQSGEIFRVEPLEGLVLERVKMQENDVNKLDEGQSKAINCLHSQLLSYIDRHYASPYAATCHFTLTPDKTIQQLTIGLTSKHSNPTNCSTGELTSIWSFTPTSFSATITTRNHFSQNGNILFNRPKTITKTFENALDLDNLTEGSIDFLIGVIGKEERKYQKQLEKVFEQKLALSIKKLRRVSPVTQGKMIWNINAVLLSEGLKEIMSDTIKQ